MLVYEEMSISPHGASLTALRVFLRDSGLHLVFQMLSLGHLPKDLPPIPRRKEKAEEDHDRPALCKFGNGRLR